MSANLLLDLPTELRLRIYDFVVPPIPLSAPPAQYTGLLCSCRLVRYELGPEILKRMVAFLNKVQARCRQVYPEDLSFEALQDLDSLYNLRVTRPTKYNMFRRDDPFMALMYMYFNTLTIVTPGPLLPEDESYTFRMYPCQGNMSGLVAWISSHEREGGWPAARRIVYDWATDPRIASSWLERFSTGGLGRQKVWKMVTRYSEDWRLGGVAFIKK
jgi:hypothetical protein